MAKKDSSNTSNAINRIKKASIDSDASTRLLALVLDVNYTTVSKWNSNISQPSINLLDKIGEFLEKDNLELWESKPRVKTGLAKAAQEELNRLVKQKNLPLEIEVYDETLKRTKKVNNPELVKKIQKFVEDYKKKTNKKK